MNSTEHPSRRPAVSCNEISFNPQRLGKLSVPLHRGNHHRVHLEGLLLPFVNQHDTGIRDAVQEPDYKKLLQQSRSNEYAYMRILSTKDVMYFDAIASKYVGTDDYKAKLEAAKRMMQGGTMTFKLKGGA